MTLVAIPLLILLCAFLFLLLLRSGSRQRRMAEALTAETKVQFEHWRAELKGRYDEILAEKQGQSEGLARERDAYKELTAKWSERIDSIDKSLSNIDQQAITTIGDMASTLKPIVSIFRSPQVAGIEFGEAELEMLLKMHLGESLYVRKPRGLAIGQEVVDFAITLPDCIVPIDSKFPSASYKAWVEAPSESEGRAAWRVFRDEMLEQVAATAKYIKPDARTTDYALLFVPSDVIYQQAFLTKRLYDQENPIPQRSQELQVFGCSTQTLMPYLGLLRLGLRNLKISEDVKGIRRQIEQLDVVFRAFSGDWEVLRGHLDRLFKHVEKLSTGRGSVARLEDAIRKLTGPGIAESAPSLPPAVEFAEPQELLEQERKLG